MTKQQEIRYHLIFWFTSICMYLLARYINNGNLLKLGNIWSLTFLVTNILIFYLNYLFICPTTIRSKRWKLFLVSQIVMLIFFAGIRFLLEEVLLYHIIGQHNYTTQSRSLVKYTLDNSYYSIRILLFSNLAFFIKYILLTNTKISALQIGKKQAELQVLKNQLSPHFLFNTLNSFYADLFEKDPIIANDILKLSEMLRYVTYDNEKNYVELVKEIEFINNYIALFKRRFEGNIYVQFTYPNIDKGYEIPSLLLIHFVENAFKHGTLDNSEQPVQINLRIEENLFYFEVINTFAKGDSYDFSGIGQKNITQRLHLLYGDDYELETETSKNTYNVVLKIPILI